MQEQLSLEERENLVTHKELNLARWERRLQTEQAQVNEYSKLLKISSIHVHAEMPGGDFIMRVHREQLIAVKDTNNMHPHAEVALCGSCFQRFRISELLV